MTRIAGLASNRGRNLLHIDDKQPGGATLDVVLSDHADAPVLDAAADRGIPAEPVEHADGDSREAHERLLLDALAGYDIDLVCLDGYMRILTPEFLEAVPPTLNVHPSLLPAFPGDNAHEQVLDAGVRVTGCTVHVVTATVDDGPIVTQEAIPVYADDDADSLKRRVLYDAEFAAYPRAVRWFAQDRLRIDGGVGATDTTVTVDGDRAGDLPERRVVSGDRVSQLRYGENPHQAAAVYADAGSETAGVVDAPQLNAGAKALSYNNYNDADASLNLIREFDAPAAAVIKHTNPAGCATADTLADAYDDALATDAMSAFGGIVALNRACDADTAELIVESFKEVVVAPGYTDAAVEILTDEDDLRGPVGADPRGSRGRDRDRPHRRPDRDDAVRVAGAEARQIQRDRPRRRDRNGRCRRGAGLPDRRRSTGDDEGRRTRRGNERRGERPGLGRLLPVPRQRRTRDRRGDRRGDPARRVSQRRRRHCRL